VIFNPRLISSMQVMMALMSLPMTAMLLALLLSILIIMALIAMKPLPYARSTLHIPWP